MNRVLAIAFKDLRSTWRNLPALMMMLAAPLALSALLGFAFGGSSSGFSIAATKVAVVNLDRAPAARATATPGATVAPAAAQAAVGQTVVGILKSKGLKDILTVTSKPSVAAARKSVDDGKDAVAVIIPADLSKAVFGTGTTTKSAI
ncbi:MAG: ABC transporter permease [Actinomycetes bacterium]